MANDTHPMDAAIAAEWAPVKEVRNAHDTPFSLSLRPRPIPGRETSAELREAIDNAEASIRADWRERAEEIHCLDIALAALERIARGVAHPKDSADNALLVIDVIRGDRRFPND